MYIVSDHSETTYRPKAKFEKVCYRDCCAIMLFTACPVPVLGMSGSKQADNRYQARWYQRVRTAIPIVDFLKLTTKPLSSMLYCLLS